VIISLTFLKLNKLKAYIITPILILCSGLILAIVLYWSSKARRKLLFDEVCKDENPSYILVEGIRGNFDIVKLKSHQN
jgi:hypothetical protein